MVGSIYALIAMGVAMIYGVMNVPDFALGAKAMLGGYVAFFFTATFHQAYGVALIGSIVVLAVLGLGVERFIFRPIANARPINSFTAIPSRSSASGWGRACQRTVNTRFALALGTPTSMECRSRHAWASGDDHDVCAM